ncbi:Uncharacterized protein Adt_39056 [Abeliophyllum distichum]|uniref:Uncharacterized protein n=1 Tax=Abeliophyllum distichum TaxID=126358 RepID=A0ABD1Q475_9LAMI
MSIKEPALQSLPMSLMSPKRQRDERPFFPTWSVITEREVDLESLTHTTLSNIVHDKGWTRLCSKLHNIYMEVMREFMVNFNLQITDEEEECNYETYVKGVWVPFNTNVIGHFYGVEEGSKAPAITN